MTHVLVTGSAGFIGSNFLRHLLDETDWSIVALDRLDVAGSLDRIKPLIDRAGERLTCVWHDLRAEVNPTRPQFAAGFDFIIHMAAGSHVERSVRDPVGFVQDNVLGTVHMLELARKLEPAKFLYFSTDEVFGPAPIDAEGFREYDAHYPNNPYAASKSAAEMLIPAYANTYGLSLQVTHCSNVYGPGQYREKFIPHATGRILAGETVQIHSRDGKSSSREYIHVDDVSRAVVSVLLHGGVMASPTSGKYNISSEWEHSNLAVAQMIAQILDVPLKWELVEFAPNRPRHDQRYAMNSDRLRALGWSEQVNFMDGLREVVGELNR